MNYVPREELEAAPVAFCLVGLDDLSELAGGLMDGSEVVTVLDLEHACAVARQGLDAVIAQLRAELADLRRRLKPTK